MSHSTLAANLRQDLSFALRTLRRNLALTILIVGALAVGIGANTAIFTLIDAVLIRQLPVSHPEQWSSPECGVSESVRLRVDG